MQIHQHDVRVEFGGPGERLGTVAGGTHHGDPGHQREQRLQSVADDPLVVGIIGRGHLEYGHGTPFQLRDLGVEDVAVLLPATDAAPEAKPLAGIADALFRLDTPEPPQSRRTPRATS